MEVKNITTEVTLILQQQVEGDSNAHALGQLRSAEDGAMSPGCAGPGSLPCHHPTPGPAAQPLGNPLLDLAQFAVFLGLVWVPPAQAGPEATGSAPAGTGQCPWLGDRGDTHPAPSTGTAP